MKKISDGLCIAHKGLIKASGTRKSAFKPFRGVILWKKLFQKAYAREVLVEADSVPEGVKISKKYQIFHENDQLLTFHLLKTDCDAFALGFDVRCKV